MTVAEEGTVGLTGVRISVGRTWRFVSGGKTCADVDLTAYRRRLDELKSPASPASDFRMPWPPYRSNVWRYLYSPEYQNTLSSDLVATLLPTRWWATRTVPTPLSPQPWTVEVEVLRHPFALTTMVHVDLTSSAWADREQAAAQMRDVLRTSIGTTLLTDGVPYSEVPSLPGRSFDGLPLTLVPAGQFVVLSGVHDEADGRAIASVLARLFDDVPDASKAVDLRSARAAISVRGENVGVTIPSDLPRAAQKLRCLHHNATTVLSHLQNLSAILNGPTTASAEWYQKRAASVLSHLYRRAPLDESGSVYKSRLPELWLTGRGLGPAISALTPGLPAVP